MKDLYPLKFIAFPQYLRFGGNNLRYRLSSENNDYKKPLAETWELSGHPKHSSVIANGQYRDSTLSDIMELYGRELFGTNYNYKKNKLFPLMLRFLDCQEDLPPAVHPDDKAATKFALKEGGKTEACYILETSSDSYFYCGNKKGLKRNRLKEISEKGEILNSLKAYPVHKSDVFLVPPGRPHSIGSGNLVYEIQRTSNAIFPFDWLDWKDKDSKRRASDLSRAIEIVSLESGNNDKISPLKIKNSKNIHEILAVSQYFVLEKYILKDNERISYRVPHFSILTCIDGHVLIMTENTKEPSVSLNKGETALIPASINGFTIVPNEESIILSSYIPDIQSEVIAPLKDCGHSNEAIYGLGGYGSTNPFNKLIF